ncbi:hypothetical protein CDD83_3406 [Cordyceps sp. RAO-2017]|nr:hypothetical protein CDD83_3406 [Cordyceps sp. RAO-2017]
MASQKGRCNCGSVTVSLRSSPAEAAACHCLNCRRTGGACSVNYLVDESEADVDDKQGQLKEYRDSDTKSGNTVTRSFCQTCGSAVVTKSLKFPGKLFLKASLFDKVAPVKREVYTEDRIDWEI